MAQNYRNENFDREFDRNFDRSHYRDRTSLDHGRLTMGDYGRDRDYEGDFGESARDYNRGWYPGDMRQNDYGTRRASSDNFRDVRWGRGEHFGKGPKGWRRSDERIREDACEALWRDQKIDATEIDVKVSEAMITLSGTVESRDMKRAAERCVEEIPGVEDVHNQLRVARREMNQQAQSGTALS